MHITIARRALKRGDPDWRESIEADLIGEHFAIHQTPEIPSRVNLTHVPTGYACLTAVRRPDAESAAQEFLASGLDWSFTDPAALTDDHKRVGRQIRQKWGDQGW